MIKFFERRKKKKGELTTEQIVVLIILIASFVILLIYIVYMQLNKETSEEICQASVVARSAGQVTPLNCQREYICLTKDGSCEGMTKPEIIKVKTEDEVYGALAEEMRNCWWMFGRGDLKYEKDTTFKQNACSICSQVFFDDSIKEIKTSSGIFPFGQGKINKDFLYEYLAQTKMPESDKDLTYSQYIFNEDSFNGLKQELASQAGKSVTFGTIEIGKPYFVVMGITTEVNTFRWGLLGAVAGGALVIALIPAGVAAGAVGFAAVLAGEIGGGYLGSKVGNIAEFTSPEIRAIMITGGEVDNEFMAPTIIEANSEKFDMLECDKIISG
jgi:hypothetical protein